MKPNEFDFNSAIKIDAEGLEDVAETLDDVSSFLRRIIPNVTVRNNQNVYVTINNYEVIDGKDE